MIPDFLTRADWDLPVEAAAKAVGDAGGFRFGINDVEGILKMAERFEGAFMRVGNKISELMEMRKFESDDGRFDVLDAVQGGNQGEPSTQERLARATGPAGVGTGQITADKVYSVLLGALNMAQKSFPDMTAGEMLVQAREMKAMIIPEIDAQLIKMAMPEK